MPGDETWRLRLATLEDIPALKELIRRSVHELQTADYSPELREAALEHAFGVDRRLIYDQTYYVAEAAGEIVGCGGWSRREATYGGDRDRHGEDGYLDLTEPARIRAFFVRPDFARRGIGRAILRASETALTAAGFRQAVIVATLTGERLYATEGYRVLARYESPVGDGFMLPVVRMGKDFPYAGNKPPRRSSGMVGYTRRAAGTAPRRPVPAYLSHSEFIPLSIRSRIVTAKYNK